MASVSCSLLHDATRFQMLYRSSFQDHDSGLSELSGVNQAPGVPESVRFRLRRYIGNQRPSLEMGRPVCILNNNFGGHVEITLQNSLPLRASKVYCELLRVIPNDVED